MPVELQVENAADRALAERGKLEQSDVRRVTVHATVDTSAVLLTLPQNLVRSLGLAEWESGRGPSGPWPGTVAGPVTIWIADRRTTMDCVVGPPESEPVVGSTVLAVMDLAADEAAGTVRPRQPGGVRI